MNVVFGGDFSQCSYSCLQVSSGSAVSSAASVKDPTVGNAKTGYLPFQAVAQAYNFAQEFTDVVRFVNVRTVARKFAATSEQISRKWWNNHHGAMLFCCEENCCAINNFLEHRERTRDYFSSQMVPIVRLVW